MNKIKKIIYWILPLIIAIYQVYLIYRIWELPKRCTIAVAIFFLATLYIMFYFYYIKIKHPLEKVNKKIKVWIVIVATVLSILCLATNFDFFTKKYTESTIVISENDQNGNLSQQLSINRIIVDNEIQKIDDKINLNPLELNFKKCKNIIIELNADENKGIVSIKDGDKYKDIDLYSYRDNKIQYSVNSNKSMSLFSIIRLICSFIMLEILFIMFCKASYYLYKKDKSLLLPMLFIIGIIQYIFYSKCYIYTVYGDTTDYIKTNPFSLNLNRRAPVYPIFIRLITFICGNDLFRIFISKIQIIISFISLIFLYKTIKYITKNEFTCAIVTFLYGICTPLIAWNTFILTESLAISGTVLVCYFLVAYVYKENINYGIMGILLSLIITFLRPSCIGYPVIIFGFFCLRVIFNKSNRKKEIKCLCFSIIPILIILAYSIIFYKQHQVFSITDLKVRQDMFVCIYEGFYKNSNDKNFINNVEESKKTGKTMWYLVFDVLEKYDNIKTQELVRVSRKNSFREYLKYLDRIINECANEHFDSEYVNRYLIYDNSRFYKLLNSFDFLKFSHIYIIMILELLIGVIKSIKNKKIDWINLGVFVFIFSILFTTFIGTNSEFARTSICVIPLSFLGICNIIEIIKKVYKSNNKKTCL